MSKHTKRQVKWNLFSNNAFHYHVYLHSLCVISLEARWPKKKIFTQFVQDEPPLFCALKGSVKYRLGAQKRCQAKNALSGGNKKFFDFRRSPESGLPTRLSSFLGVARLELRPVWSPLGPWPIHMGVPPICCPFFHEGCLFHFAPVPSLTRESLNKIIVIIWTANIINWKEAVIDERTIISKGAKFPFEIAI